MPFKNQKTWTKWIIFFGLYLLLVISSNYYIASDNQHPENTQKRIPEEKESVLLVYDDPLSETSIFFPDSVYKSITVIHADEKLSINSLISHNELTIHVLGIGVGTTKSIQVTSEHTQSIASLSLIDPIGIPELELLGGSTLNNAFYKTALSVLNIIKKTTPNFGRLQILNESIEFLRTSIQQDASVNRDRISRVELPVFISLSNNSNDTQKAIAEEFYRIVPQSIFWNGRVSEEEGILPLKSFLEAVENKSAITYETALASRITESKKSFDPSGVIQKKGKALLVLMLIIILSTLVSEDLTCIGTGLMIARGIIGFIPGVIACLIGIFVGDILLYLAGRWLASSTLQKAPLKWFISEKDIERSYFWFEAKGPAIIIMSRFIPGSRMPTYFSAGAIGASFGMFILYFGIASLLWTPILVGLAVFLGQNMLSYFTVYQEYAIWVLFGVLSALFVIFKIIIPSFTYKGRRLLVARWKRIIHWEYWPPFLIYLPVLLYVIKLWLRYRKPGIVTLANPGIELGGFINESKSSILDNIKQQNALPIYQLISYTGNPQQLLEDIQLLMQEKNLAFPIVLKPDKGERGKGVQIVKNVESLSDTVLDVKEDVIIQEFIPGIEYGVFYYRIPDEPFGKIYSITKKHYQFLTGDGIHTIEELILKDDRAVCQARMHFDCHIDRLFEIPERGEKIPLVEIGTHALGSKFEDANHLITDELTEAIDQLSKSFDGFYFG